MTTTELKEILADHAKWLADPKTGKQADLREAYLGGAYLRGANLRGEDLRGANLSTANLRETIGLPEAPTIENLDAKILDAIESPGNSLNMGAWHTCKTTHCRAGWAITLAGEAGKKLEKEVGPSVAGALIYHASTGRIPDFYATNEKALTDMRKRAGR